MAVPQGSQWARHWTLDPEVVFLNHGSFGACPRAILERQAELRAELEREPVLFLGRRLEGLLEQALERVGRFVGARAEDLAFVSNASTGINTVLRSLRWGPDDELLVTNQEYNATRNALAFAAEWNGAKLVVAPVPFPVQSADEIVQAILEKVTPRTRLALVDHVTSQTGLVYPIERIARELNARGVDLLVDGAHAPGMVPLEIEKLGVAYYTGNCHKWLCTPKGAAILYVRKDRQTAIRPLVISHGANSTRTDRSRFQLENLWTGTDDPTAFLCVPECIDFLERVLPGGIEAVRRYNHSLALQGREVICRALGIEAPAPEELLGSLVSFPIQDGSSEAPKSALYQDALHGQLFDQFRIEVPVMPWPHPPRRLLRISAQLYNAPAQYEYLGEALKKLGVRGRSP